MTISETTSELAAPVASQSPSRQWLEVLLIVLVFFIATGDPAPSVNETHYIARLKHYWNPQWCEGDLFLQSTDTQVVFIWLFGWLTRFLSLAATTWVCRVICWLFLAWSWQRLSWSLAPRRLAAVLSASLFLTLNYYGQLAGEWVVGGVEAKCFAYAFVFMALRDMACRRWGMVCLLLGAAMAFHPIVGGWSALVCAVIWLIRGRREQSFRSMLPGIIGGTLLALIGILPALSLTWHEPAAIVSKANQIYVFDRLPHHLSILTMPPEEVKARFTRHGILLAALVLFGFAARRDARLRPIVYFAWGAVIIACIGFAIEIGFTNQPAIAAEFLRYYWFRLTDFAAPMAVSLLATSLIALGIDERRRWAIPLLSVALLFCGLFLASACQPRIIALGTQANPVPPADAKSTGYSDWIKVCDWIAENTPPDALFITPRLNQSFKWRTGRAEVVNKKDIPQDARGIVEWDRRLKDIYYTDDHSVPTTLDSIGARGTDEVRALAEKYHADYVLSDRSTMLTLPIVYRNDEYVVYQIKNRNADHSK
jgi:hypothetical protein